MSRARLIALGCAAAALAVAAVAVIAALSVQEWRLSALVRMSPSEPMADLARRTDPDFAFVHPAAHYDGVYFYAIAIDPLARGEAHRLIDRAAYRYGHAGYGWLAWLASAGQPAAVPAALLWVALAGVAVAGYAASRLAAELGWSAWGGLVVALTPGVAYAVTADTSEPVALAVLAAALLAWQRRRWGRAAAALAAGCLIKEPLLLVPAGLGAWELLERVRGRRDPGRRERALAILPGPLLFVGWQAYLRATFGVWSFQQEAHDFLTVPFYGWADTFRRASTLATGSFDRMQIGNASVPLLAVVGGALLLGVVCAVRLRSPLDPVFLLLAWLMFSLNWYGVLYPKDLIREVAIPLALLPAVVAGRGPRARALAQGPPGH